MMGLPLIANYACGEKEGCVTDRDCRAPRVCEAGRCVDPDSYRDAGPNFVDNDGDGYDSSVDCNDNNTRVYPGASEIECNGIDEDCDGKDYCPQAKCVDEDGDGYGVNCEKGKDCNDTNSLVHQKISCEYDGESCGNYRLCLEDCPTPPEEICDGKDNDCDGSIDEDLDCVCADGETQQCGVTNVGECRYGTQTCRGGSWGDCIGAVNPSADENCDGKDNDCDGSTDEGFDVGNICYKGIGECKAEGTYRCKADGSGTYCDARTKAPSEEICDEKDNDCDGETDEGDVCVDCSMYPDSYRPSYGKCCTDGEQIASDMCVVDSFDSPGSNPRGLTFDGTYLWNADYADKEIYKIVPSNPGLWSYHFNSPGDAPGGLTWDGEYLWNADFGDDKIYKLTTRGQVIGSLILRGQIQQV